MLPRKFTLPHICVAGAIAWFIFASFYFYFWAGSDDDLITQWSGETLGREWWFINFNGERSEMTSSILAACVAKISALLAPTAPFTLDWLLLFISAPATLYIMWRYRTVYLGKQNTDMLAVASITVASFMPFLQCWAQSNMEAPLHTLLLTWYAFALIHYMQSPQQNTARHLIILQIFLCLVRPEGFWAIGTTFIMLVLMHGRGAISCAHIKTYAVPLAGFFILVCARFFATGVFFPNPAYAKMDIGARAFSAGWERFTEFYSADFAQLLMLISFVMAFVTVIHNYFKRPRADFNEALAVLTLIIGTQQVFFIVSGGSLGSPFSRLLVPTTALQSCLVFCLLVHYRAYFAHLMRPAVCLITAMLCADYLHTDEHVIDSSQDNITIPLRHAQEFAHHSLAWPSVAAPLDWQAMHLKKMHNRDIVSIGPFINDQMPALQQQLGELRILTSQAGFFPYYVKKRYPDAAIRFFDPAGLMSADVGRISSPKTNKGNMGLGNFKGMLSGQTPMSKLVYRFNPNMIYTLSLSADQARELAAMGWQRVYTNADATILVKK